MTATGVVHLGGMRCPMYLYDNMSAPQPEGNGVAGVRYFDRPFELAGPWGFDRPCFRAGTSATGRRSTRYPAPTNDPVVVRARGGGFEFGIRNCSLQMTQQNSGSPSVARTICQSVGLVSGGVQ